MTTIIDQYEQDAQNSQRAKPSVEPMVSSGYIDITQLEDNTPMFKKNKMNLNPSDMITHAAISNDYLVLAMANGRLFRLNMTDPKNNEEIHYTKFVQKSSKLNSLFLDPLGYHLLMSFTTKAKDGYPELAYLHRESMKPKLVTSTRNYEVTDIGWNMENTSDMTTGPILLGTSQGHILESEVQADNDKMFIASQKYWKQLFDINTGKGTESPITGLQFHRVSKSSNKYCVFVTTPTRLYQFIGQAVTADDKPLSLQSIFYTYLNTPETGFQEIPSTLKYSKLQFYYDKEGTPKTFAWLTEPGIFYGNLDPTSQQNSNSVFTQGEFIDYPSSEHQQDSAPLNFVVTEFHALIMFSDRVKVVSLLNHQLVLEDIYTEAHGQLKTIVKDIKKRTIYAITDKTVFRYKVVREERNIWKIYSDKEQFNMAKEYCFNNPAYIDIVYVKQAELLFSKGEYDKSAKIYAETQSSFETVCLKFLDIEKYDALKVYLSKRLEALPEDDKTLISMLVIWMTELYISRLGMLRRTGQEDSQNYHELQSDFEVFLVHPKVSNCMQHVKTVIYDLMSSHGDKQNLIKLCLLNEDYENVIGQYIHKGSFVEALNTLKDLKKPELFYQFTPVLLEEQPMHTVNALISQGVRLLPSKLLPGFLSCPSDEEHVSEIIRYLEFMLQNFNVKDKAIHNYLLTLYVEHDKDALMKYLNKQGQDMQMVNYDVHYALRLCREKNLTEACVKLSAVVGLCETAVELALGVELSLAKSIAALADTDDAQRRLWLTIAEHVITKNQDIQEAMGFLQECPLIKIEDILPFFSDVTTIDHFRAPICDALMAYNSQMEEVKAELEEATKSSEYVRSEIASFRNQRALVSVADTCCQCSLALLLRPFYLFPCTHRFHADCLAAECVPILPPARRKKLSDLQRQLSVLSSIELDTVTSSGLPLRDVLRSEVDDIIAAECIFCGEHMINCIDKPFIPDEDWDRVMKEWE